MTGSELQVLFRSSDFTDGLKDMSSYLASIMQERPIVYLLAKCLWKQKYKFKLEDKKHKNCDLYLQNKRIEFKFNYNKCQERLAKELAQWANYDHSLEGIQELIRTKKIDKSRGIMPRIFKDVWEKEPDIFVWIICSRDLSEVAPGDLERVCVWPEQKKYDELRPYNSDGELLTEIDSFLGRLQSGRSRSRSSSWTSRLTEICSPQRITFGSATFPSGARPDRIGEPTARNHVPEREPWIKKQMSVPESSTVAVARKSKGHA
jgi:hypothetical protein